MMGFIMLGPFVFMAIGGFIFYKRFGGKAAIFWIAITVGLLGLNVYLAHLAEKEDLALKAWTAATLELVNFWFWSNPIVLASAVIGYVALWVRDALSSRKDRESRQP